LISAFIDEHTYLTKVGTIARGCLEFVIGSVVRTQVRALI
jgi:hypothetical protein